jgi:hypothetical protein
MQNMIENETLKILTTKGWKTFPPRQTRIVESHDCGSFCVVRESYMGFKGSNVYAIDDNLQVIWEAELPHSSDIFANILIEIENGFETTTWNGIFCHINLYTGKTTKLGVTK